MQMTSHKKNDIIKYGVIILLLLLFGSSLYVIQNLKAELTGSKSTIEAVSNEMTKYRDKSGLEVAQKQMILTSYKALKAIHASDSSEIGRLQKIIDKNTLSATILGNKTTGKVTGKTTVTFNQGNPKNFIVTDPKVIDIDYPCDTVYPTYRDSVSDKWATVETTANRDSIVTEYSIRNEYEITQEYKKVGKWPFRNKVPYIMVKNLNPHTETTEISSYAVQVPKTGKKMAIVAGASAVIGLIIGVIIAK